MSKNTKNQVSKNEVSNETVVEKQMIMVVASKSQIANKIFDECYKMATVPQRKDILARVKKEAGLTDAGAATYLQNYKKKHGLTKSK